MKRKKASNTTGENPKAEKRSISGPSTLFEKADAIAKEKMFSTFSGYVQSLIKRDLSGEMERAHQPKPA